jgi:uncharacterized protein
MKTKTYLIIGALIVVAAILALSAKNILAGGSNTYTTTSNTNTYGGNQNTATNTNTAGVQNVKLSLDKNYNYQLTPSVLKKGVPVRMEVDLSTVVGCARSVTIPELGVRKIDGPTDNVITFTPTKTGTFKIACSMNMYVGTFSVTDDGQGNAQTQQAQQAIQTQAASTPRTGCGCGGGSGGSCGAI